MSLELPHKFLSSHNSYFKRTTQLSEVLQVCLTVTLLRVLSNVSLILLHCWECYQVCCTVTLLRVLSSVPYCYTVESSIKCALLVHCWEFCQVCITVTLLIFIRQLGCWPSNARASCLQRREDPMSVKVGRDVPVDSRRPKLEKRLPGKVWMDSGHRLC